MKSNGPQYSRYNQHNNYINDINGNNGVSINKFFQNDEPGDENCIENNSLNFKHNANNDDSSLSEVFLLLNTVFI